MPGLRRAGFGSSMSTETRKGNMMNMTMSMQASRLTRRRAVLAGVLASMLAPRQLFAETSEASMRIRCTFSSQQFTYRMLDNATTRDLLSLLPLDLTIEDFSNNEKLAHLPRRLDEGGHVAFDDEAPGDLCYFLGWGNLAFFHDDYTYRGDLIRLGHIEGGVDPLLVRGTFPVHMELIG